MRYLKLVMCTVFNMLLLILFLNACGMLDSSGSSTIKNTETGLVTSKNAPTPITLKMYINYFWWDPLPWGEDLTTKEITAQTGVTLDIDKPSTYEDSIKELNLMASSDDYPDLIMTGDSDSIKKLKDKNAFVPMDKFIEKYGSNIKKNITMEYLEKYSMEKDGKIYGLPNGFESQNKVPMFGVGTLILKSIYTALGSPRLDTINDMYNYLVKVRDAGFKTSKGEDIIPAYMDWPVEELSNSFGVKFFAIYDGSYVYGEDGQLRHIMHDEKMKEIFRFSNQLFREKLIDQEWFLQPHEKITEKIDKGRVAVYFSSNALAWMDENLDKFQNTTGDLYFLIKPPLAPELTKKTESKFYTKGFWPGPWSKIYITKKCKDTIRAVEFFNWVASEKGQYTTMIGPEGVVWQTNQDGALSLVPEFDQKLRKDPQKAYRDIGYMKWCFLQNNKYKTNAYFAFKTPSQKEDYIKRGNIIAEDMWYAQELENLKLSFNSPVGIANTNMNIYFTQADKQMYMAKDKESFEVLYQQTLAEMERLGVKTVEDELNRQIIQNRK
jgi:putative aldouronate transport system substrate-binding protein